MKKIKMEMGEFRKKETLQLVKVDILGIRKLEIPLPQKTTGVILYKED